MRLETDEFGFSLTNRLQLPIPATAVAALIPATAVAALIPATAVLLGAAPPPKRTRGRPRKTLLAAALALEGRGRGLGLGQQAAAPGKVTTSLPHLELNLQCNAGLTLLTST